MRHLHAMKTKSNQEKNYKTEFSLLEKLNDLLLLVKNKTLAHYEEQLPLKPLCFRVITVLKSSPVTDKYCIYSLKCVKTNNFLVQRIYLNC